MEETKTVELSDLVGTRKCIIQDDVKNTLDEYAKIYYASNLELGKANFDSREAVHFSNFNIIPLSKIETSQQFPIEENVVITLDMYIDSLQTGIPSKFGFGFFAEKSEEMIGLNLGYQKNFMRVDKLLEVYLKKKNLTKPLNKKRFDFPINEWINVKIEKKAKTAFISFYKGNRILAEKKLNFPYKVTTFSFYSLACSAYISNVRLNDRDDFFGILKELSLINKFLSVAKLTDKTSKNNPDKNRYLKMIKSGDEYRKTLLALPSIKYSFTTALNEKGKLQFGYGIDNSGYLLNNETQFKIILIDEKNQNFSLFEKTINPSQNNDEKGWIDKTIDLSEFSGQTVKLDFITQPAKSQGKFTLNDLNIAAWSNPIIVYPPEQSQKPNIILISIDTQRADRFGTYGYNRPTTPNIDAFAKDGIVFENAISTAPYTLPSHMSIFTSLYPSEHGVTHWTYKLDNSKTIYSEIIKEAGYRTAAFTAGSYVSGQFGFYRGFDSYYDSPYTLGENELSTTYEKAQKWLEDNHKYPFSMFFHTFEVHPPFFREDFVPDSLKDKKELSLNDNKIKWNAIYDSHVLYMDKYIGKLIGDLKRLGVYNNTIIVLTSDHGEELFDRTDELAGHGHTLYRDQIHVPLIVIYPNNIPADKRVSNIVSTIDIAPTILEYAGISIPHEFQGKSLQPLISGDKNNEKSFAYSECTNKGPERKSVVYDKYHYINIPDKRRAPGQGPISRLYPLRQRELFIFNEKPLEKTEISKGNKDSVKFLQTLIDDFISTPGKAESQEVQRNKINLDPETIKRLKALGYIK